jgi:peptidoglycan hydrolase-like protein with peptidoglycan-binding domain
VHVKEVQRLLVRIGYRPGPVDGVYGPLTRSSVQWFQIKHSLRPSGVVDEATLALLRLRSRGASPPAMPTTAPPLTAAPPSRAPGPAPTAPATPAAAHKSSDGSAAPAVVAGSLVALALLLLLFVLLRRRRGRREAPPSAAERPSEPQPPRPLPAHRRSERVVAYTSGRNPRDLRHQAETIERACSEHGWALAQVVRERRNGNGHRPGLRFALEQLANGGGTRLVTCRVRDVGRSRGELSALLGWCARTGVDLMALDVGLDTSTRSGRLVARSLVTPGRRTRFGRSIRRRRGNAPGVDGELAPSSST